MNAAIASASLLGFGDKPASQSIQSFAETLNKMYESQLKAFKGEETSRKSAIEEYNKQQRAKKKKESDIQELLKKMAGGEGEGKKTKKKGGGLLTALLGGTALIGGAALLAPVIAPLVIGIASKALGDMLTKKVKEMVDPIVESITKPFDLFFKEQEEGEEGEEVPDGMVRNADGRLVPSDMPSSRDMDIEEIMVENADGRMVPREMPASRNMDVEDKSPAQAVSDAVSPSTSSDSGGGTDWDPVLEMISSAESRGRYDIMYGGEIVDGITEMTIAQAAKRAGDTGDGKNYAIGKYQFITLVEQAKAAGLNPNKDKFSPKNQDKIAIDLITRKRGVTKQMAKNNPKEAGKRLAMEWAGLPVLAPTKGHKRDVSRGQSYYAGDGVNKSTITPEQVEASFQKLQKGGMTGEMAGVKTNSVSNMMEMVEKQQQQFTKNQQKRKGKNGAPSEDSVKPQGMILQKKARGGKIFLHWAGSEYTGAHPNYHATIQGDGSVDQTRDYDSTGGGHTHLRNNQGIGLSLAAMRGASDKNFGSYPVKPVQYEGMSKLVADIATKRGWGVSDINVRNVMTHAEAASGKDGQLPGNDNYGPTTWGGDGARWDLWKLYQNDPEGSGGGKIRNMIRAKMGGGTQAEEKPQEQSGENNNSLSVTKGPTQKPTSNTSQENNNSLPVSQSVTKGPTQKPTSKTSQENNNSLSVTKGPTQKPTSNTSQENRLAGEITSLNLSTSSNIDSIFANVASQALAPIVGAIASISGIALTGSSGNTSTTSGGGDSSVVGLGGGGAASVNNPNAKALLNAIADAEGTSQYAEQGYRTMFTGKQFSGEWKHPEQVQSSSGYSSDAAGRYQFLSTTWKEMGMPDFSPASQDQAALKLVSQAGVNINDGLSEQEIYKVGQKWASVEGGPSAVKGGSYGAQAKYSATQFMKMYEGYGGEAQKLQQGGTVGGQINTGTLRGVQNTNITKLKEMSQKMKKRGPKVIRVQAPPTEAPKPIIASSGGGGQSTPQGAMIMSELADYMHRVSMGALA